MWSFIKKDIKSIKYHVFGILAVIIKYVVPLVFVISESLTTKASRRTLTTWGLIVVVVCVLIYFFSFRRFLASKLTEEKTVSRLNLHEAHPLLIIGFTFLDDVIMAPILPLLLWFCAKKLEEFSLNVSSAFMILGIMFVIGGILKLIDVIINLNRKYENYGN